MKVWIFDYDGRQSYGEYKPSRPTTMQQCILESGFLEKRDPEQCIVCMHGDQFICIPQNCYLSETYNDWGYQQLPMEQEILNYLQTRKE